MIGDIVKSVRTSLGYTQMELAYLSKVSLPSVQNIEANKANPSLETIGRLFNVLGLELNIGVKSSDWDTLSALGIPIMAKTPPKSFKPSSDSLVRNLKTACLELLYKKDIESRGRKKEVIEATLLAIRDHYPTFFKNKIQSSSLLLKFVPRDITGRHIKLRRLALARISSYL